VVTAHASHTVSQFGTKYRPRGDYVNFTSTSTFVKPLISHLSII